MRKIILSFVICLLATVVVYGQTATELKTALQLKLDEWHKAGSFPGATLGVALPNGESFGLAVGFSDRETRTAMKPTDRLLAGSVGKTFAAATALQLIKEGKIGLDDKIEKYLGHEQWFARLPNAKAITVRQLMNHTSGLVRYEFKEQFTKDLTANPEKEWKPAELVAYLLDEKPPFEAGKGWDYSDTNYIVLGIIIEKVTGKKFYDEANRRLLKPLKLTDTIPQDGPRLKGVVQGYAGPNNPFGGTDAMIVNGKFAINPQFEWTGGGYASTAHDLARWAKMIYEGKAFSPDLLPQVLDGVSAPMLGRESKYGLGVIIRKTQVGTSYGHSGFFPGYMTDMAYFPEHKIAVAVQVNTSVGRNLGKPLSRVLVEMMEVILAKQGEPAKKDIPVADRFEDAIKTKETRFKLASKLVRNNEQENYVLQGWKSDDDIVSATTYELASPEEAAEMIRRSLNAPVSVPVRTIKLTQLGDEAYLRPNGPYAKEGQTDLLFRKGNFVIVMSASKPDLAQRFAKHFANEIQN
ncbi:MAG TPA: serine hydrolase domain-containing protein [Pyrinomonadaceae bacterium]|nr:serine hydrolase domain-containing protein [Pyrinomonadaceae bacterium]